MNEENPTIRVMGLHSLLYCERLFYLEEVEGILIADDRVYAGRTLHEELKLIGEDIERKESFEYTSDALGLTGKMDRLMKRDGNWIVYEHKRGRSKSKEAWETDKIQVAGYAALLEEESGREVSEARIRYHADGVLVKIPIDDELREKLSNVIERAHELYSSTERPDVADNENLCARCSLAPACLPEETRLDRDEKRDTVRLFPEERDGETLHVTGYKDRVKKESYSIVVVHTNEDGSEEKTKLPSNKIESVCIHGSAQISTQMISYLTLKEIPVHWFTGGGSYIGGIGNHVNVQRKIRQYEALRDKSFCLDLTRKLVKAKAESQIRYILRASRKNKDRTEEQQNKINRMRELLSSVDGAENVDSIRGYEGSIARIYHSITPDLLVENLDREMIPDGRTRRPPQDPYNAALSFLYSLLYRSVNQAIISVGLEPAFGFYHTPRSTAPPLVLDLMELFRVSLCDIPLIGSLNRMSWNAEVDFVKTKNKVWLSDEGRKKAIRIYEERLDDEWKHPVTGYSVSYYGMIELEVRLLEKEWSDRVSLFARARLR